MDLADEPGSLQRPLELFVADSQLRATINLTAVACDFPIRDKHEQFDILTITLIVITGIVVGLRFFEKLRYGSGLRLDDYVIFGCFLVDLGNSVVCLHGLSRHGLGRDAWRYSPDTITTYLCFLYAGQTLYATDVFATKICVLLFYLNIFPGVTVRRLIWGTVGTAVLCMVIFDLLALTQCQPISFYWKGWDQLHKGHCIGINSIAWAIAAVGIIMDFWMLAIPISQLIGLQMKWKRKLAVASMFGVGTFVTVVSILRLRYLVAFGNSNNPTCETQCWYLVRLHAKSSSSDAQDIPKTGKLSRCYPKKRSIRILGGSAAWSSFEQCTISK
ncbi:hypothetical protein F53441_4911 [Fusarium austroafricanum]|uniref:Rhodopsin domain-containing protein n=1 Tax=Fusarium austroafricanum TaxID=2364996 RepID=A0A8H4KKV7_9HYPO|nr:hypothetical protein F53441_4911 [Fusarium austroafricanum]